MYRLRLLAIPVAGALVLMLVLFARMGLGNAFAASTAAPLNTCGHWTLNASPNPGTNNVLDGVAAITKDDTWAVGYTDNQTLTEHWNGSAWSVVASANQSAQDQLVAVAAVSSNNVWAVGSNGDPLNISQPIAEHWNGSAWSLIAVPAVGVSSQFTSVAHIPDSSNVWAVGHFTDINNVDHTLIERWNGTAWSVVPSPDGSANGSDLLSVVALSSTSAWAVGTFSDNHGNFKSLIERWNGTKWSIVSSPDAQGNSELNAVTHVPEGHVYYSVGNSGNNGSFSTVTEQNC